MIWAVLFLLLVLLIVDSLVDSHIVEFSGSHGPHSGQPSGVAKDTGDGKEDVVPIRATNEPTPGGVSVLPWFAALEMWSFDLIFSHFKRSRSFMLVSRGIMCLKHYHTTIYI